MSETRSTELEGKKPVGSAVELVRISAAIGTLGLLILGVFGALIGPSWLGSTGFILFVLFGPGAALIQVVDGLDTSYTIGIASLAGPVIVLMVGFVMVEIPFWHPLVALFIVAVPSAVGSLYGLRTSRPRVPATS